MQTFKNTLAQVLGDTFNERLINALALLLALFQLYTGYFQMQAMDQRIIHLMIGYVTIFLYYDFRKQKRKETVKPFGVILALIYLAISVYLLLTWDERLGLIGLKLPVHDLVLGAIMLFLTLEGARRVIGGVLPSMVILIFFFAVFGEVMPGIFSHKNYPIDRIIYSMTLKTEGLYGSLTGISATFIYLLILFGVLYNKSGAGKFFMDFANSLAGHLRGGTAKVAIIASSLFGMISGSGVANTAATGNMTIPIMKQEGYQPYFAAALVATAGSGGLIMPPIMGSAVFVMMAILGVPYMVIMERALTLAVFFYLAVFLMTDLRAMRYNLLGKPKSELPKTLEVVKKGWNFFLPPLVLVVLLAFQYTIIRASFFACISIPFAAGIKKSTRMSLKTILESLRDGSLSALSVIAILSAASIAVGLVDFTGLGLMISSILIRLSGGNLFVLLVLTMIAAIVLGMGVPPVAAYIVLSILVAPALIQMGVWDFAAHMFVFYFSVIAEISPPVAPNAYVACGIAETPLMKTSLTALRIAFPIIIFPYAFVYNNALLLRGSFGQIAVSIIFSIIAIIGLCWAWEKYCFGEIKIPARLLLATGSILLIFPQTLLNIVGLLIVLSFATYKKINQNRRTVTVANPALKSPA